ncbi:hypothetical protein GCM10023318_30310 [Nocardia callitridis]|uniref:Uncharacterized protein n=1 Tax=Nocardia callitridis TaxID=648753 RepID=A0ABP9KAP0_9NOCA
MSALLEKARIRGQRCRFAGEGVRVSPKGGMLPAGIRRTVQVTAPSGELHSEVVRDSQAFEGALSLRWEQG